MTRDELLDALRRWQQTRDHEGAHYNADMALLEYINDPEITAAFEAIRRWYS
jgi:hypothetical protein